MSSVQIVDPANVRVLIVDDFQIVRIDLRTKLETLGYLNVTEARDGTEGLELVRKSVAEQKLFHVILSDWNMPRSSGIELLQEIRKSEDTVHIPFIMITSETDTNSVLRALKAGATDYVGKPITLENLSAKLNKILSV